MEDYLDRAKEPLAEKLGAYNRLEIRGLAVCAQKAGKRLQSQERLLFRPQKPEVKPEAMETVGSTCAQGIEVMHGYDRILAHQQRAMTTDELDRLFPAQDIDRFTLLQIAEQSKIPVQDPVRRRIPTGIDDKDLKARTSGCRPCRLLGVGKRLDDRGFFSPGVFLQSG
jgi:hypothetical protein